MKNSVVLAELVWGAEVVVVVSTGGSVKVNFHKVKEHHCRKVKIVCRQDLLLLTFIIVN